MNSDFLNSFPECLSATAPVSVSTSAPLRSDTSVIKLAPLYTNLFSTNQGRVSQECRIQTRNPDQRRSSEESPRYYGCFETPSFQ